MNGNVPPNPRFHSCCSLAHVCLTSFIKPPTIMFGIILLYLLFCNAKFLTQCVELFRASWNSTTRKTLYVLQKTALIVHRLPGSPIVLFGLAFLANLLITLHKYLALKWPVNGSSTVQSCCFWNVKYGVVEKFWHRYLLYTGCNRRNGPNFRRVFLMLNYADITQNTYVQSWTVSEIMTSEVWNFDSCYTLTNYQIHIETGRNMWFL